MADAQPGHLSSGAAATPQGSATPRLSQGSLRPAENREPRDGGRFSRRGRKAAAPEMLDSPSGPLRALRNQACVRQSSQTSCQSLNSEKRARHDALGGHGKQAYVRGALHHRFFARQPLPGAGSCNNRGCHDTPR